MTANKVPMGLGDTVFLFKLSDLLRGLVTVHFWHIQVHENCVKHLSLFEIFLYHLLGLIAVKTCLIIDPDLFQLHLNTCLNEVIIIHNQHDLLASFYGLVILHRRTVDLSARGEADIAHWENVILFGTGAEISLAVVEI
mgnify:CR=1 FL=1